MDEIGCVNNTIITSTGKYFDYVSPQHNQIDIKDIATALGNLCRYNGQLECFYSVAEHCVHASQYALSLFPNNMEFAKTVLLHDAAEAYIGDMPKPLKVLLPEYQDVERRVEFTIFAKFDVDVSRWDEVKSIDHMMLKAEHRILFPNDTEEWTGFDSIDDIDVPIQCWTPRRARAIFLNFFDMVTA